METGTKLWLLAALFVGILAVGILGSIVWLLLPYAAFIRDGLLLLLCGSLVCGLLLAWNFTTTRIGIWQAELQSKRLMARTIIGGEVVAYLDTDGSFIHLSALHESAKVQQQLLPPPETVESDEPPEASDDDTVLEMLERGISYRSIAEATHHTYYYVQDLAARHGYGETPKKQKRKASNKKRDDDETKPYEQWEKAV